MEKLSSGAIIKITVTGPSDIADLIEFSALTGGLASTLETCTLTFLLFHLRTAKHW